MPILGVIASSISGNLWPANSYYQIGTTTVGAGGASSVTFSGIPSTYTHLQVRVFQKSDSAGDLNFRFNSDSGANYSRHYFFASGSTSNSGGSTSETFGYVGYNPSSTYFSSSIIDILDYTNTNKNKIVKSLIGTDVNSGSSYMTYSTSAWFQTSAITSITFNQGGNTFSQHSTFALYGIKVS
jgi:hypothetical protein